MLLFLWRYRPPPSNLVASVWLAACVCYESWGWVGARSPLPPTPSAWLCFAEGGGDCGNGFKFQANLRGGARVGGGGVSRNDST